MERLIRQAINDYARLKSEAAMFERHLEARENTEMREALVVRQIQIGTIESWFTLLNTDEKVALRQALKEDDAREVESRAAAKWMSSLLKDKISPWMTHEDAIAKIVAFANTHCDLFYAVFLG